VLICGKTQGSVLRQGSVLQAGVWMIVWEGAIGRLAPKAPPRDAQGRRWHEQGAALWGAQSRCSDQQAAGAGGSEGRAGQPELYPRLILQQQCCHSTLCSWAWPCEQSLNWPQASAWCFHGDHEEGIAHMGHERW